MGIEPQHELSRLFYDQHGERGVPPKYRDLPVEIQRVVMRAARVRRLLEMADRVPVAVLEAQRRMVAEAIMELVTYMQVEVMDPAIALCNEKTDAELLQRMTTHLQDEHGLEVAPQATLQVLIELHTGFHDGDPDGMDNW